MDRLTRIHAIREALETGSAFDRILIAKGRQDTASKEIGQLARCPKYSRPLRGPQSARPVANSRDPGSRSHRRRAPPGHTRKPPRPRQQIQSQIGLIVLLDGVEDPPQPGASSAPR